jgi:hypothetical protein
VKLEELQIEWNRNRVRSRGGFKQDFYKARKFTSKRFFIDGVHWMAGAKLFILEEIIKVMAVFMGDKLRGGMEWWGNGNMLLIVSRKVFWKLNGAEFFLGILECSL